jgi:hypothetical protein
MIRAIGDIWFRRPREFQNCCGKGVNQAATDAKQ